MSAADLTEMKMREANGEAHVESENATEKESEEDPDIYELYWAQNTSAHGISRVIATTRIQRAIWIIALIACFVYVSYEIYKSIDTYNQFLTTTEINKINSEKIDFPAVTFCNFNRWRKSKLTKEALANLREVLSVYSYDYVIPELSDSKNFQVPKVAALIDKSTTTTTTTTTTRPLTFCVFPEPSNDMGFVLRGDYHDPEKTSAVEGSTISYVCKDPTFLLVDGDIVHNCTESGEFEGRKPLCVNDAQAGELYSLVQNDSSFRGLVVTDRIKYSSPSATVDGMTLCFWIKTFKTDNLGTFISYGQGNESVLSVIQVEQKESPNVYGIKYKLFGAEGGTVVLTGYNQWIPLCLQYSTKGVHSQLSTLKVYKHLVYDADDKGFQIYGDDDITEVRNFSFSGGQIVYFNEYETYLNFQAGQAIGNTSAGGHVANVNMWDRVLSVEVMNRILWSGNVYNINHQRIQTLAGSIDTETVQYNANELQNLRVKRQVDQNIANEQTTSVSTTESLSETNETNSNETVKDKDIFNFAAFTRKAGWQLVDKHSNHSKEELKTLLSCTYRGKNCDSRWFSHKFGAYGNCYTFNHEIPESLADEEDLNLPLFQDSAGPIGGLKVMFDIQTWEYAESIDLSGNSELGLKFIVHTPYQTPVINAMGYSAGPGQKAFVGFLKNTVTNLYPPWGKCDPDKNLTYSDHYTVEACAMECKLQKVVAECGCKPYYFPGDYDDCTFSLLNECAFIEIAKINADFGELCDCPIACKNEEFEVKLSYSGFPNFPYGSDLGQKFKISLPPFEPGVPEYATQVQYIRGNVISLDLYFESMSEMEMIQNKAMDSTALLGSIGGHLGLFIGCSVLTAVEFLECIIMSVLGHCKRAKDRRQKPENMEEAIEGKPRNAKLLKGRSIESDQSY